MKNKNLERGYRDVSLNLDGSLIPAEAQIFIQCTTVARNLHHFIFSCTIIAVKFGDYCIQNKLGISLL